MRRFYLKYSDLGIYSKVSQFLSEIYRINIKIPPKRRTHDDDASGSDAGSDFSAPAPAPAKRVRKSSGTTASAPASHTLESLLALPHDELAKYAYDLQTQLSTLQQSGGSGGEVWSDDKVAERAKKTRDTGTTKWSYTGIVPHEDVFYKLFGFEKPKKAWKQKKIDMADFEEKIGYISNSIRYNNLRITGDGVKVHWDQEEKTFKLTGTYGL
ncbi:hypothetical protein D6C94_00417 [Aureobasidium pullulans]|uniref:Uncharacterized protein n=1 Tax=Aureobasidium pullulans TaxID=5580 RepID=A0AB38MAQ5_AURPU|nr:hypothetical protein D6C94_00417 [Aureobasidium pullulans]